ncbi:MAG: glycyl-radical enzyme activating protein [Desulfobacterales bacterium]|nr:glycyl-radical enzyme activating protein [Desulfobacterales bacterium]
MDETTLPLVFDIAMGSFADGPGVRTVVFLKGCPLRCIWCQNPESRSLEAETFFYPERCIECGNCDDACYSNVRITAGRRLSPAELAGVILQDKLFFMNSSGGVTFSGGEPLLFIDYLRDVSSLLKREKIHIAIETSGYFNYGEFEKKLLPYIDLMLYDIKLMDPGVHEKHTGKSNEIILGNFKKLLNAGVEILPRVPLIPGFTATRENLSGIADFLKGLNVEACVLLPYNPSGRDKWVRLGKKKPENVSDNPMPLEEEKGWIEFFKSC